MDGAAETDGGCALVVVATDQQTSPLWLRDRLALEGTAAHAFLDTLRACGVDRGLVVAGGERVAVLAAGDACDSVRGRVLDALAAWSGEARETLDPAFYVLDGAEAVRHLFATAAALDNHIMGEAHHLETAHTAAREAGMVDPALEALLQAPDRLAAFVDEAFDFDEADFDDAFAE